MALKSSKLKSSQFKETPSKKRKVEEEELELQNSIVLSEKGKLGNSIIKSRVIDWGYFGAQNRPIERGLTHKDDCRFS